MNFNKIQTFYIHQLEENFIPFWEKAIDEVYGGVFTCFTNDGDKCISDRKYVWSQGRFLWLCCYLQKLKDDGLIKLSEKWKESRKKTYHFLKENARMSNNHIVFALEKDGRKISDQLDVSIFADCFYVLGCNAYAQYEQDEEAFEHALCIYETIKYRIERNTFKSEPYPIPTGYRSHSIPMILLNVVQELQETLKILKKCNQELMKEEEQLLLDIIQNFSSAHRIKEMKSNDLKHKDTLLSRHVNPGHTLESVWFMLHSLSHLKLRESDDYIHRLSELSRQSLALGWDDDYGGLFRFVDKEGGIPKGQKIGDVYESLIIDTWDTKLWWPHSEALYTTLLLYKQTKDDKWIEWYQQLEKYIFKTFPNTHNANGEWIQIRNREGNPIEKVVALPVKDPFHIIRNFIHIIRLLEGIK